MEKMKNVCKVLSDLYKVIIILSGFVLMCISAMAQTSEPGSLNKSLILYASAAEIDVTPALGIQISGGIAQRRPVEEIRDRVHARALVLKMGNKICCLVSSEISGTDEPWDKRIRQLAAKRTGIPPDAILLHFHQGHATPSIGNDLVYDTYKGLPDDLWWVRGGDPRYNGPAVDSLVEVIVRALALLEPVTVSAGRDIESRVAFNRRFIMRKGIV